jgi:hypothetical protein
MRRHLFCFVAFVCVTPRERGRALRRFRSKQTVDLDLALYTTSSSSCLLLLLLLHFHLSVSCSNLYISRSQRSGQLGRIAGRFLRTHTQQLSLFSHHQTLDYFSTGSQSQQSHHQTIDIHNDALPRPIELDKQTARQFSIPHIPHLNS